MRNAEKGITKNRFVDMGKKETRHGVVGMKGLVVQIPFISRIHIFGSRKRHSELQRPPEVAHYICLCACVYTFFWLEDS